MAWKWAGGEGDRGWGVMDRGWEEHSERVLRKAGVPRGWARRIRGRGDRDIAG